MVIARNFGPRGGGLRCTLRSVCVRRSAGLPGSTRISSSSSSVCWRADVAGESTWTLLPWQVRHYPEAGARCVACSHKIDAVTLLGRTLMSLWIANNMGQCVESFCNKRWDQLTNAISTFGSVTLGAALLNALLKYFVAVTALDVRQRLTRSVHKSWVAAVPHPTRNMLSAGCACAGTCTTWRTTRPTRWQTLTA